MKKHHSFFDPLPYCLQLDKSHIKQEEPLRFQFLAQFYPESINDELTSAPLRRLLWLQIRNGIIADEIYCPPELCVLFASQSVSEGL